MNNKIRNIKLGVDEPWDSSRVISGEVVGNYRSPEGKTYFTVEDSLTGIVYIITNRYKGDDLMDVFSGKKVIVAIALPKKTDFTYDDPNFLSCLSPYGIGYIVVD
jgi:hypothetical protein